MQDIKVNEALWASSMLPEGIVERWFIADGAIVAAGDPMAEIRIEDALHEIMAPVSGRLTIVAAPTEGAAFRPNCPMFPDLLPRQRAVRPAHRMSRRCPRRSRRGG
jgi:hypothetical protein